MSFFNNLAIAIFIYTVGVAVAYYMWKRGKYTEDKDCIILSWVAVLVLLLNASNNKKLH